MNVEKIHAVVVTFQKIVKIRKLLKVKIDEYLKNVKEYSNELGISANERLESSAEYLYDSYPQEDMFSTYPENEDFLLNILESIDPRMQMIKIREIKRELYRVTRQPQQSIDYLYIVIEDQGVEMIDLLTSMQVSNEKIKNIIKCTSRSQEQYIEKKVKRLTGALQKLMTETRK